MKENVTIEGIGKARCFKMGRSKKNYGDRNKYHYLDIFDIQSSATLQKSIHAYAMMIFRDCRCRSMLRVVYL